MTDLYQNCVFMTIRITFLPESNKRILRIFLNLNKKTIYSQVSDIHRQARPWLPCEILYAIYIYILHAGTFHYSQHALNYNFISEPFTGMKKSGSRSSFKGLIHSCKPVTFCLLFDDFFIQVIVLTVLITTYIVFIQI